MFSGKKGQSIVVYLMFAAIIIVFIISFGPGSQGAASDPQYVAIVNGEAISLAEYRFEYNQLFNRAQANNPKFDSKAAKAMGLSLKVLDNIENMMLFASEAEEMGFGASDTEVSDLIVNTPYFQTAGKFDKELYSKIVQFQFNMSITEYEKKARRAILYSKLMTYLSSTVTVSDIEIKEMYLQASSSATIDYFAFAQSTIKPEALEKLKNSVTSKDSEAYIAKNDKDLVAKYEAGKDSTYKGSSIDEVKLDLAKKAVFDSKFADISQRAAKKALLMLKSEGFDQSKFAAEFAEWNVTPESVKKLSKIGYINGIGYDKDAVDAIFADKKLGYRDNIIEKRGNSYIIDVKSFNIPDLTKDADRVEFDKNKDRFRQRLSSSRFNDVFAEFGKRVKEKAVITVNSKALSKIGA